MNASWKPDVHAVQALGVATRYRYPLGLPGWRTVKVTRRLENAGTGGEVSDTQAPDLSLLGEIAIGIKPPRRILVTGSRTWTDEAGVDRVLRLVENVAGHPITLVHGGAGRGLDRIARDWAAKRHWQIECHSAEWDKYGRRAGHLRNAEMVAAGADLCLAFIHNHSPGASNCARSAERAGIPTWRWNVSDDLGESR